MGGAVREYAGQKLGELRRAHLARAHREVAMLDGAEAANYRVTSLLTAGT